MRQPIHRLNAVLERYLPEKRLFLRSEVSNTRYLRLRPVSQALMLGGGGAFLLWSLFATAMVLTRAFESGDAREIAVREQIYIEQRIGTLVRERDRAVAAARSAEERYLQAMDRVAAMQGTLLVTEQRRAEMETGIEGLQTALRARMQERDEARARLRDIESTDLSDQLARLEADLDEARSTLDTMLAALTTTAEEREALRSVADAQLLQLDHLALEMRLVEDRNERIFGQLEQAVEVSMVPMERMFRAAGLSPQDLLRAVRSGRQTRTAALTPITISTSGALDPNSDEARANAVLAALEEIDLYRIAMQRTPFAMPLNTAGVRQTSGFGTRRDPRTGRQRMHNGVDWAGPRNHPILATASGTVTHAGWRGGYGRTVVIQHDFGIETLYAHLNRIDVNVGDRVSRGDRIGGMGTTGRSTGVHLHYEIRVGGRPINPLTYIRAARDVF